MELEARVRAHVASGLYGSASEVIREALRLFEAYQSVQQSNLAALKADIDQGMADLDAGRVSKMDMAAIKAQGRSRRYTLLLVWGITFSCMALIFNALAKGYDFFTYYITLFLAHMMFLSSIFFPA
eukprot:gene4731-4631_t